MIDNSQKIRELLKFPKETSFYFLQILQRRKENPDLSKNAVNVDNFFIYSLEDFDKYLPRVKECCDRFNARAYIRLNIRDAEVIAQRAIQKSFDLLIAGQHKQVKNAYLHACGEFHSDDDKTWVVDLDKDTLTSADDWEFETQFVQATVRGVYTRFTKKFSKCIPDKDEDCIIATFPTVNGMHIITKPFRLDKFKEACPKVDVHKDNPTILYCP